jgi:rod shape-determining protein MreB
LVNFPRPIEAYVLRIENLILKVLEGADPELVSDVLETGVWLSGGGALLSGLSNVLERRLGIVVRTMGDPLGAVISGNGMIVRNSQYASLCRTDVN